MLEGGMMQAVWILFTAIVITSATSVSVDERNRQRRGTNGELLFDLDTRLGANNEVILRLNDRDVVSLIGNNPGFVSVNDGERVEFNKNTGVVSIGGGRETISGVSRFGGIQLGEEGDPLVGEGIIYTSHGSAFFVDSELTAEMDFIIQNSDSAPPPKVVIDVRSTPDNGDIINVLDVTGDASFIFRLTGSVSESLGAAGNVRYRDGVLTTPTRPFPGINDFYVIDTDSSGCFRSRAFDSSSPTVTIRGPGQLFVGLSDAVFIEDIQGSFIIYEINSEIVSQTFTFNAAADAPIVMVTDAESNPVILLSPDTKIAELSDVEFVSFDSALGIASFLTAGGRVIEVAGLQQLSVFDNNALQIFRGADGETLLSSGGSLFVDTIENTALFVSDANPAAAVQFFRNTPPLAETVSYSTTINSDGVRLLLGTSGDPPVTETVQTLTGSYVTGIRESESIVYSDNRIIINNFQGSTVKIIENVDELITDTGPYTSGNYSNFAPVPFLGPSTLSYSRGTAFLTNDDDLGQGIKFLSSTAPIPDIDYELVSTGIVNEIDGVNYTVYDVVVTIGGDRVVVYEITSYTTSSEQEILYADDLVTVHTPIYAGGGSVVYNGGAQTVTYRDRNGTERELTGIDTFRTYSGGEVTTYVSPEVVTVSGPGKIYVSEDGTDVLFSTSNIITSEVAGYIREGVTDFAVDADQFSSIFTGVFNLSTDSATVTYRGGGIILSRTYEGIRESLYVADSGVSDRIREVISTLLVLTKSVPAKINGVIRPIFNGRVIYEYTPVIGSREVIIGPSSHFTYDGMSLVGDVLPGGPYEGINKLVTFDGVEVKMFNSSTGTRGFYGFGFLIYQAGTDMAFFTTSRRTINYLIDSIAIFRRFLRPPRVRPGEGRITTKEREQNVTFGTDVTAFQGATIHFECDVEFVGRPNATVQFFELIPDIPAILLNTSGNIIVGDYTLYIMNIDFEDAGEYACLADNGVPPLSGAHSFLSIREAVPPVLVPRWFPFDLLNGQKIVFPTESGVTETVDLREFQELIIPCRVEGRPRPLVEWRINDVPIEDTGISEEAYDIKEVSPARSVLIFDLLNHFNETMTRNELLGTNVIQCSVGNDNLGTVTVEGEITDCGGPISAPGVPCSTTCGYGLRDSVYDTCFRYTALGVSGPPLDISEVPLRVVPLIDRQEVCTTSIDNNVIFCPIVEFLWNTSEWSECSRTCGGGFQTREVNCLSETFTVTSRYQALVNSSVLNITEDGMCEMFEQAGPKPADRQLCELQDCPFWQTGDPGPCTVTCGGGVRMRDVDCVTIHDRYLDMNNKTQFNITILDDSACNNSRRPDELIPCNEYPCFFQWRAGQFGPCGEHTLSGSVAEEFRYCKERSVICLNDANEEVNATNCDSVIRPSPLSSCHGSSCFVGLWNALPWNECTATCGYGYHTREAECYSPTSLTLVPNYFCDISKRPPLHLPCFLRNCPNVCLRDESRFCPYLARAGLCRSPFAMANGGMCCCVSCRGLMAGGD